MERHLGVELDGDADGIGQHSTVNIANGGECGARRLAIAGNPRRRCHSVRHWRFRPVGGIHPVKLLGHLLHELAGRIARCQGTQQPRRPSRGWPNLKNASSDRRPACQSALVGVIRLPGTASTASGRRPRQRGSRPERPAEASSGIIAVRTACSRASAATYASRGVWAHTPDVAADANRRTTSARLTMLISTGRPLSLSLSTSTCAVSSGRGVNMPSISIMSTMRRARD